ncbi:MAG: hypothetical protein RLZZ153_596 [Pseudomonadota bacterium]|jgi:hypothetical protein
MKKTLLGIYAESAKGFALAVRGSWTPVHKKARPIRPDVVSLCKLKHLSRLCCRLPEDRSSALAVKPPVSALAANVVHRR